MANNHLDIIIGENAAPVEVKIKVEARQVGYFRSFPLHYSQEEIETKEDYSVFKYQLVPTSDFYQEILSKGSTIEVLSPDRLRCQISDTVLLMSKIYKRVDCKIKEMTELCASLFINMAVKMYAHFSENIHTACQEELKSEAEKRGYKYRLLPNGNLVVWIDDISVEFIQDDSRRCFKIREFEYVGCGINADAVQVYDFIEKYCLYKKVLLSVIDLGFDISVSECAERAHLYQQTCAGKDIK